jgi:hypothetical protein
VEARAERGLLCLRSGVGGSGGGRKGADGGR